jgi:hypothetical protein
MSTLFNGDCIAEPGTVAALYCPLTMSLPVAERLFQK